MKSFWLLSTCVSSLFLLSNCETVHVNSRSSSKECSMTERSNCPTLDKAYEKVKGKSNVTLIIESNTTMNKSLEFSDKTAITIKGINSSRLVITCNGNYGMYFENVNNVILSDLVLTSCMFNHSDYYSAVIFKSSADIAFNNFDFFSNSASGLILLNCTGRVALNSTNFVFNGHRMHPCMHKYGALNIESQDVIGHFSLTGCHFLNNINNGSKCNEDYFQVDHWGGSSLGGGMRVIFGGDCNGSKVIIKECNFTGNIAGYGAGLYTQYQDYCEGNDISIDRSTFIHNWATNGGGGLSINLISNNSVHYNRTNSVNVSNTDFVGNKADYGVGVWITSKFSNVPRQGGIHFSHCNWSGNVAKKLSPALDISSYVTKNKERLGHLPVIHFHDINVIDNVVQTGNQLMATHDKDSGVLLVAESKIVFNGVNTFTNNSPSALQAVSGEIALLNDTQMIFNKNSGVNGGAIALYGYSYILLHSNVTMIFSNNTATSFGGGIYHHGIDQHQHLNGFSCFIEYNDDSEKENVKFYFTGNKAKMGKWIYAETFYTCFHKYHKYPLYTNQSIISLFLNIRNISHKKLYNAVTSSASNFSLRSAHHNYVIPGKEYDIGLRAFDEFNQTVTPLLTITVKKKPSIIRIANPFTADGNIIVLALENITANITVTAVGVRTISFTFNITTLICPPGFFLNKNHSCQCGENIQYTEILSCNLTSYTVQMKKSYWAGYIPKSPGKYSSKDLYFAPCMRPLCNSTSSLPSDASALNEYVCGANRKGIMCGMCKTGSCIHFHSNSHICGSKKYHHYGLFFFFLSEIVPITIFYLIVVVFDITFTTGNFVGFLFFSQNYDQLTIKSNDPSLSYLEIPYKLFYGIFNLEYFNIDSLSYCLWKNMKMQDVIAVKYVSLLYSLILVILTIMAIKSGRCNTVLKLRSQFTRKYSYVHGLSAFLAISHIQCTKTSFLILRRVQLQGWDGYNETYYTYYGGVQYGRDNHLIYLVLAIFVLITVSIIPTIILLVHPLVLQILALCNLSEHWIVLNLLRLFQVRKLIPFLDCFQSCYKDRYRFFAGVYYLYRTSLLICFATTNSILELFLYAQVLLLLFLGVNALVNPCKKKSHNRLNALVFFNLCLINMLSVLQQSYSDDINILYFQIPQMIFISLPMSAGIIWFINTLYGYFKSKGYGEVESSLDCDSLLQGRQEDYQSLLDPQSSLFERELNSASHIQ